MDPIGPIRRALRTFVTDLDEANGELAGWLKDGRIDEREFPLLRCFLSMMCKRADWLDEIEGKLSELEAKQKAPQESQSFEAIGTKPAKV